MREYLPVLGALVLVDLAFVLLNLGSIYAYGSIRHSLHLDLEISIPTWGSSAKYLLAALCFFAVSSSRCRSELLWWIRPRAR
jgi:hypothetical protein